VFKHRPAGVPDEYAVQVGVGGRAFDRRHVEGSLRKSGQRVRQTARQQKRRQCAECVAAAPVDGRPGIARCPCPHHLRSVAVRALQVESASHILESRRSPRAAIGRKRSSSFGSSLLRVEARRSIGPHRMAVQRRAASRPGFREAGHVPRRSGQAGLLLVRDVLRSQGRQVREPGDPGPSRRTHVAVVITPLSGGAKARWDIGNTSISHTFALQGSRSAMRRATRLCESLRSEPLGVLPIGPRE
jgi:hypothetical protein